MNSAIRAPFGTREQIVLEILQKVGGSGPLSTILQLARERELSDTETKSAIQILVAYKKIRISVARRLELIAEQSAIAQREQAAQAVRRAGA